MRNPRARNSVMYFGATAGAAGSRPQPTALNAFNWRLLGGAGAVMLVLALWMNPGSARPAQWDEKPVAAKPAATLAPVEVAPVRAVPVAPARPHRVSVLDVVGKISLVILLLYGLSFGLTHARKAGLLAQWGGPAVLEMPTRLQVRESLPLGRQEGTLYLLEVDGQAMLLASTADQLQMLWSAAPEQTSSFPPVEATPELKEAHVEPSLPVAKAAAALELPLFQRGIGKQARQEADWARERSRLISALAHGE